MALDKIVDSAGLEADLAGVADAIRAKGGTASSLTFPSGFVSAVDAISTGVEVQTKSGSGRTSSNGVLTINCGFKPDLIILYFGVYENDYEAVITLPLKEQQTSKTVLGTTLSSDGILEAWTTGITNTGATIAMYFYDWDWTGSYYANKTVSWRAVKYSE